MVEKLESVWKEILNNQSKPLIGANEAHKGNGYHDVISWRNSFNKFNDYENPVHTNTFYSIYLRNLGLFINPSLSKDKEFEKGLKISNCSENYQNTLLKFIRGDRYKSRDEILKELGNWGKELSSFGRLIIEIKGWYDNTSNQFYGFELKYLQNEFCTIKSKHIIYNAPFEVKDGVEKYKKVNIPRNKCIIIEFPNELGGYIGFTKTVEKVLKLGDKFNFSNNSLESLSHYKQWDKDFNKIISKWGGYNKDEEVTEFYKILSALRFKYMVILCTHEIIKGLEQLINYLNEKLGEEAIVELNMKQYDIENFKEIQNKWMTGELSFEEVNKFLNL